VDVIFERAQIIWHQAIRDLCKIPYEGEPNGRPMYGTRPSCPPEAPLIDEILDLAKPTYIIAIKYDLASRVEQLRGQHPDWSEKKLRCSRYWQGIADKLLREAVEEVKREIPNKWVVYRPEANGVNVSQMMKKMEIKIWPLPEGLRYRIAVAGDRKRGKLRGTFHG